MYSFRPLLLLCLMPLCSVAETLTVTIDEIREWQPIGVDGRIGNFTSSQEKVMGKSDFIKVAALPSQDVNKELSKRIGIFLDTVRETKCSGSLVGPNLFLTNHHCVANETGGINPPDGLLIWMEYLDNNSTFHEDAASLVSQIISHDKQLDYALLKLHTPLGNRFGWLALEGNPHQIQSARHVKIIQHPQGRPKEIVVDNTQVVNCDQGAATHYAFCYLADTEGGSSGSPVFNLEGDTIIALHNMGMEGRFNAGIQSHFIVEKIRQYLPDKNAMGKAPAASPPKQQPSPAPTATPAPAATQEPPADKDKGWKPII